MNTFKKTTIPAFGLGFETKKVLRYSGPFTMSIVQETNAKTDLALSIQYNPKRRVPRGLAVIAKVVGKHFKQPHAFDLLLKADSARTYRWYDDPSDAYILLVDVLEAEKLLNINLPYGKHTRRPSGVTPRSTRNLSAVEHEDRADLSQTRGDEVYIPDIGWRNRSDYENNDIPNRFTGWRPFQIRDRRQDFCNERPLVGELTQIWNGYGYVDGYYDNMGHARYSDGCKMSSEAGRHWRSRRFSGD